MEKRGGSELLFMNITTFSLSTLSSHALHCMSCNIWSVAYFLLSAILHVFVYSTHHHKHSQTKQTNSQPASQSLPRHRQWSRAAPPACGTSAGLWLRSSFFRVARRRNFRCRTSVASGPLRRLKQSCQNTSFLSSREEASEEVTVGWCRKFE